MMAAERGGISISIIVENSDLCLGPAAQWQPKLFPRTLFEGLGGTIPIMSTLMNLCLRYQGSEGYFVSRWHYV